VNGGSGGRLFSVIQFHIDLLPIKLLGSLVSALTYAFAPSVVVFKAHDGQSLRGSNFCHDLKQYPHEQCTAHAQPYQRDRP
jgi:hypothetical protein